MILGFYDFMFRTPTWAPGRPVPWGLGRLPLCHKESVVKFSMDFGRALHIPLKGPTLPHESLHGPPPKSHTWTSGFLFIIRD